MLWGFRWSVFAIPYDTTVCEIDHVVHNAPPLVFKGDTRHHVRGQKGENEMNTTRDPMQDIGERMAQQGRDEYDLDEVVHNRAPDGLRRYTAAQACAILTGYYAAKRRMRESWHFLP